VAELFGAERAEWAETKETSTKPASAGKCSARGRPPGGGSANATAPEAGFLVRVHPDRCLILMLAQIRALLCASKSKFIRAQTLTLPVLDKKNRPPVQWNVSLINISVIYQNVPRHVLLSQGRIFIREKGGSKKGFSASCSCSCCCCSCCWYTSQKRLLGC
jgi:hypothetical protein